MSMIYTCCHIRQSNYVKLFIVIKVQKVDLFKPVT